MKKRQNGFGVSDEHVAANVEFAFVDEQRIVNVLLNDASERLGDAESTLLAVVGELEFLFERLGTSHQIDAFALIQRHRFADPQLVFWKNKMSRNVLFSFFFQFLFVIIKTTIYD